MTSQQLILPLTLPPSLKSGDFIISTSNEEALSWLGKWPQWPQQTLLIYGGKGAGKTHLASIWKQHARSLNAEDLREDTLGDILTIPDPHLVMDDAETLQDEVALFHLLNAIRNSQGSLLLFASAPPQMWALSLPDLQSRLNAILAIGIQNPDDHLIKELIKKYVSDQQIRLPIDVLNYLFHHLPRSYHELWENLERINAAALQQKRPITIPLIKDVLALS